MKQFRFLSFDSRGDAGRRDVSLPNQKCAIRNQKSVVAFTLIELLVVIAIIGLLAGITIPNIKGMTKSNGMAAADRQLLDDLAYARQRAMADHTTVYVVFVPPSVVDPTLLPKVGDLAVDTVVTNLYGGQYTTYALFSLRKVGEQPGRTNPRYLTNWRTLPNGVFIANYKFQEFATNINVRAFSTLSGVIPFPMVPTNNIGVVTPPNLASLYPNLKLPYLAFDYHGQLMTNVDEIIPLAQGSIFYARDNNGTYIAAPADLEETPRGGSITFSNQIRIDWLTGRARVEKQEIK